MKIGFWGAAKQVTGSMYMLTLADGYKILIDCGLDFEKERQNREIPGFSPSAGQLFPFEPSEIHLLVLTHAHVDHSGNIPNLVKEGYEGQILCTQPTMELSGLLLEDSARIHKFRLNAIHGKGKKIKPHVLKKLSAGLYLEGHVRETMERFVTIAFNRRFRVHENLYVTFYQTGHLLGAASILMEARDEQGSWIKIGFSGDIGRKNYPLLKDPDPFPEVDYLICESTYGNRNHTGDDLPEDILEAVIKNSLIDFPGRLIIPSFSVGRTQSLLYTLNRLQVYRKFPEIKVFTDSPMAQKSSRLYEKYRSYLNDSAREFYEENEGLFDFENLHFVQDLKSSKAISLYPDPCIIISSSGMIQGGRIENHILANLENPFCTIFMIGFSAEGTTGHELLNGASQVIVKGKKLEVKARILKTDVFSGHADLRGLMAFVEQQKPEKLKKLFLVHGEEEVMADFQKTLEWAGFPQTEVPEWGEEVQLI